MLSKIKEFAGNLLFSIKVTYEAAHRYFVLKILLSFVCALTPFLYIYFWKNIINILLSIKYNGMRELLFQNIIAYMALYFLSQCLTKASEYIDFRYNDMVNIYVENILLDKFSEVDLAFYDSSECADKLNYTWQIKNAMTILATVFFYSLQTIITFIVSIILLSKLSLLSTIIILLLSIPTFIFKIKSNAMNEVFSKENAKLTRELSYFKNLFRSTGTMYDIKMYDLKDFFLSRYSASWTVLYKKRKELTLRLGALAFWGLMLSAFFTELFAYGVIIYKLIKRVFRVGEATYFIGIYDQLRESLTTFVGMIGNILYAYSQLVNIKEFIESTPTMQKSGTLLPDTFESLFFDNVSFKYPGSDKDVLNNCSFSICKGDTVGLVGENGSGKSTIAKLILRLYDVDEGQILLNGIDIREYDIRQYRSMFSALFQDFIEYSFTLRMNVALSDLEKIDDSDKVRDALDKSEMTDIIQSWEKGLETPLTREFEPDGKELSGGQWQRIALARVFFADRDFVVLDEPSASLDVFAEEKIFSRFEELSNQRTSVIISHRLSSIVNANKIVVLKGGKIIEEGSHKELIEKNGYYAELFKLQANRYYVE